VPYVDHSDEGKPLEVDEDWLEEFITPSNPVSHMPLVACRLGVDEMFEGPADRFERDSYEFVSKLGTARVSA